MALYLYLHRKVLKIWDLVNFNSVFIELHLTSWEGGVWKNLIQIIAWSTPLRLAWIFLT